MLVQLGQVLLYSLIPVAASGVGGLIATFWPPNRVVQSMLQHFAAGVVLAAAALELLPPIHEQSPWVAVLGFTVGIVAMVSLRWLTERAEAQGNGRPGSPGGSLPPLGLIFSLMGSWSVLALPPNNNSGYC